MRPEVGSYMRDSSLTSVLLPAPLSPTTATTDPGGSHSDTSERTSVSEPG